MLGMTVSEGGEGGLPLRTFLLRTHFQYLFVNEFRQGHFPVSPLDMILQGVVLVFCFGTGLADSHWPTTVNSVFRGTRLTLQPDLQANLASAVQLALENCQQEFKWDRWNCPETAFSRRTRGPTSHTTKEYSYVLSITSAAIAFVVTRNCSKGNISGCGCDPKQEEDTSENEWVWGGCSEFTDYGEEASKKYLDNMEIGMDALTYMNLHNYAVGREVVRKSLRRRCKCHGMSGSCTVKSCWMQMAPLKEIAYQLRKRYDRAVRVDFEEGDGKVVIGNSVTGNVLSEIPKADNENLVYLHESPNYCLANNTTGWRGTLGRTCSRENGEGVTLSERKSCRHLCRKCGHTVRKTKRTVVRHCNCTFKWCCEVKCDTCTYSVIEHFCARPF